MKRLVPLPLTPLEKQSLEKIKRISQCFDWEINLL